MVVKGIGEYTCVNANGASFVDYLLIDVNTVETLTSFDVLDFISDSIHFPISFSFALSNEISDVAISEDFFTLCFPPDQT